MLTGVLRESGPTARILSFLRWTDCVSLASTSSHGVFLSVKHWVEQLSRDVSLGVNPSPIPCQSLIAHSRSRRSRLKSKRVDLRLGGPVPPSFKYLNEAVYSRGCSPDHGAWDRLAGCSCKVSCGGDMEEDSLCPCMHLNALVQSGTAPLFECHAACSCDLKCSMRATQLGSGRAMPRMKLEFMGQKGWGAFSVDAIPRGTFVAEYAGEALTVQEARRRVLAYDRDGLNYVLVTQEFFQGGKQVWRTVVDATTSGNVSRFFNHSCDPTLGVFVVRRGSMAPRLAFFTLEDVAAGCELTYDYEATGSAGGNSSRDHEFSQPVPKILRRLSPPDSVVDHECRGCCNQRAAVSVEERGQTRSPGGVGDRSHEVVRRRVWTDDPYNFNISDSLGGNDSKKKSSRNETAGGELGASRSKQTRIAKKHSLSKSIIKESSLRSMSLKHQESAELSKANSTAVIDSDATRRKSIPATTASALDKAMGFLQKYKKEGASTPTTSLGTQQTSTNRRWSAANASSDEEDGMDISLGSDGDEISRNVTQRTKSRLKPNRIPPAPEPSRRKESAHEGVHFGVNRSLTDVPPSDHFATARDLGITATEGLDRPKTSVSPVGLDRCKARYDIEGFGIGHETDTCLAQEGRTSGLRFSVSIPGSPSSDVVRQVQGDDSDCVSSVKSITSAVVEDIQPEEHDERRTRRISSLDLAGSGEIDLERRSGPIGTELGRGGDRSMNQREDDSLDITTEADDRMFERIHAGSDFGKLSLFDDGDTSVDPGHHQALIPGHTTTMTETRSKDHGEIKDDLRKMAPADAKDDDSYEDDDFEDVVDDSLESSERDLDDGEAIRHEGDRHERDLSPAIGAIPIHDGDEERTSGWKQEAASEVQPPSEGIHSREHLSFDETRQAWDQGTRARSPNLTTTIKGNNPDNDHEAPATSNASNSAQAHLPTTKESWVVKGRKAVPSSPTNETTIATQCIAGNSSRKQALVGGGLGGVEQVVASAGGVSKRGVRIDRSAEMLSPQRPPNSAIKILRSNAVASVEFAHDPDRGLDLRSIGTQAIGNTAAVQASIVSPGMRGTESVLDDGLEARGVRTPGVGYRTGESYAIWGRFACEAPASRLGGRYYEWDQGATATSSSSHCRPQSLDREMMAGEGLGAAGSVPETISDSDESTTTRGGGKVDGQSTARIPARSDDFDAPGIPSYLQVFLGAMAKSQEESCAAWTKALEETVETRGSHPSLALEASFQSIRRCVSSQPLKSYVALNKLPTPTPYRLPAEGPVEGGPSEKTKGLCDRGDADAMGGYANEIWRQSSGEIDTADVNGMVLATEDSFRQQLADLRRNLNEIRHRAEGATCSGYKTYKYETLADARNFIARVRPSATSYAEALRTVDPSLTPKEATALADGHDHEAIPSSPTEPCTTTDRAKEGAGD